MSLSNAYPKTLDPTLLHLNEQEAEFLKSQIGIRDDEALRNHIIEVQKRAYEALKYGCIHSFSFTKLKIARLPAYRQVLQLHKTQPNSILLDIGSGFGNDIRKAVADGWSVENAIASDISRVRLRKEFWNHGHKLFKTTPETFPASFIPGDAFSSTMIEPREPFYSQSPLPRPADLKILTSLTPLQGHISVIHASLLFHLFDEEKQLTLAKQLATLLSPEPGSIIFGVHGGLNTKGMKLSYSGRQMFCHSPESWIELWDGVVFRKGSVKVEAMIVERESPRDDYPAPKFLLLVWAVTRL